MLNLYCLTLQPILTTEYVVFVTAIWAMLDAVTEHLMCNTATVRTLVFMRSITSYVEEQTMFSIAWLYIQTYIHTCWCIRTSTVTVQWQLITTIIAVSDVVTS